jgi:cytochrome c oxidase subunit II
MSAPRLLFLASAALLGMATLLARGARAQPLTPSQEAIQQLFYLVLVPAVGIGILVMALVAYAVLKYRVRPGHTVGPVNAKTHDRKLETLWTVIPAIILLVVGIAGFQTLVVTDTIPPNPDVIVIVTGVQWAWSFNVTDPNDPESFVNTAGAFTVRVGQVVKLVFRSEGERPVAHAFSIPAYNLLVDVMPGRENVGWFQALAAGEFEVHCREFCGLQHHAMAATLHVIPA